MEKAKGTPKAVYNWSYVQCVSLWCSVLASLHENAMLNSLIYPLVQVAIGCIRLRPTAKFFPLRFHILRSLILLERQLDIYIPVLPLIYEVFRTVDFNQKPRTVKPRPIDFSCQLRLSSSHIVESSFRTASINYVTELITEYAYNHCCAASFPELVLFCILQVRYIMVMQNYVVLHIPLIETMFASYKQVFSSTLKTFPYKQSQQKKLSFYWSYYLSITKMA
ncbi:unnamed protein product [Soboliphyme baturini]|uniref:Mediator of RNA polymerase II transcription subunit 23 n=1 Tax=Soboliphyme baturini TaxID=241478 RepID=A0A183I9J6_9BILA|nr:unnamed protein product [Soboliphyme baturini]